MRAKVHKCITTEKQEGVGACMHIQWNYHHKRHYQSCCTGSANGLHANI